MMVLKPNGIFQALYTGFQLYIKILNNIKSQPELCIFLLFVFQVNNPTDAGND